MQTNLLIIQQKITNAKAQDDKSVQKECIMTAIEYLKLQAKNLHKDFKTRNSTFDPKMGHHVYEYFSKFFRIEDMIDDLDIDEENFKLGNAQHIIAKLCGLKKWSDLAKATPAVLELSFLLYTHMDRVEVWEWDNYVSGIERENNIKLDDEFKLQIFKEMFLENEQDVYYDSYRISKDEDIEIEWEQKDSSSNISSEKIFTLPLTQQDRTQFIDAANRSFERIFNTIEPENPEMIRSLWSAELFIDSELLNPDMLPIDKDYALSLVNAFMVGYVIQLASEADKLAELPK